MAAEVNRLGYQYVHGSQEVIGCRCGWPLCVAVVDEVLLLPTSRRPHMVVDRWFDCILCGRWVHRLAMPVRNRPDGVFPKKGNILPVEQGPSQAEIPYPWVNQEPKK